MKTIIVFFCTLYAIITIGFSTDKSFKIKIPDQQVTATEKLDSVIGKQFNTLITFVEKEVQFYKTNTTLSTTDQDDFFAGFFNEFDIRLEAVFRNIKLYAENYRKANESSLFEKDILEIVENEKYLEIVDKNYKYLKNNCTLNTYDKNIKTKKIEKTLATGLMSLCWPIYNDAITLAFNNWPTSEEIHDWRYYIIVTQLYNDKLINPDEISRVQISTNDMFVNGKKQSNEVFIKYLNLYKQYYQEETDLPFDLNISSLLVNELYLSTDEILNQGVQEWNEWRAKEKSLIPAINNYDFQDKNLEKVNFSSMHFEHYNFKNAILDGANLQNVVIKGCDFSNTSLINVKLTGAKVDNNTKFPAGFNK
jgi:hypothetical protein